MKATIEFTLPDESEEYRQYNRAIEYYSALIDIQKKVRRFKKNGEETILLKEIFSLLPEDL